jgi:O-antigen ligase
VNAIEQVMVKRSSHFKLALAVIALVLVLWATGSSTQSLWLTPVIIVAGWIALRLGLRYREARR